MLLLLKTIPISLPYKVAISAALMTAMTSLSVLSALVFTSKLIWLPLFWFAAAVPILLVLRLHVFRAIAPRDQLAPTPGARMLHWAATVAVASAVAAIAFHSHNQPHGGWDAIAIWNLKARFIFFGVDDGSWARMLDLELSHPDYPILLPVLVARFWLLLGEPTVLIPAAISIAVFLATVLILHAAIRYQSGRSIADLSVIILLTATFFIQHAAAQFADNYLALFILGAGVLFKYLLDARIDIKGMDFGLGILLGLTVSIKNEGLLVTTIFLMLYGLDLATRSDQGTRTRWKRLFMLCLGWLLVAAPTLVMKQTVEVSNDLLSAWSLDTLGALLSWERLAHLLELSIPLTVDFLLLPLVFTTAAAFAVWAHLTVSVSRSALLILAAPALIIVGYMCILWATPHDMKWHVTTTLQRLWVHVWPLLVFALASSLKPSNRPDQPAPFTGPA